MRSSETIALIRQLGDLAMRKLMGDAEYEQDLELLLKSSKKVPKKASVIKRDLDAKKETEKFRAMFQMPSNEKLDGQVSRND